MNRMCLTAALLSTATLATPATAEITPVEVWGDLRAYMESVGYEISGSEEVSGETLTIRDVVLTSVLAEDAGTIAFELGTVALAASGDGVTIDFAEEMPIRFAVEDDEGQSINGSLAYRQTGLDMRVTGTADAPRYAYDADRLSLALTDLRIDGDPIGRDMFRFEITAADVTGTTLTEIGTTRALDQALSAGTVSYELFARDPDNGANVAQISGALRGLSLTGATDLPIEPPADGIPMPGADVLTEATARHEGAELAAFATEDAGTTSFETSSESGGLEVTITETGLGYGVTSRGIDMRLSAPDLPLPLALSADKSSLALSGPVRPTETPEAFALSVDLQGFEMADVLWNMLDPGQVLPRDPAMLQIDLSGRMRQLVDFFAEDTTARTLEETETTELHALSLDRLALDLAGAMLTGSGAFTFDNDDLQTFEGFPAPDGALTLELAGANLLLDRLVRGGLLPQDEAMGARMMMSMFARPVGDDVLTTTIEIHPDGRVVANGQRLR